MYSALVLVVSVASERYGTTLTGIEYMANVT